MGMAGSFSFRSNERQSRCQGGGGESLVLEESSLEGILVGSPELVDEGSLLEELEGGHGGDPLLACHGLREHIKKWRRERRGQGV